MGRAFRDGAVSSHDSKPRKVVVRRGQDAAHEAGRDRVEVAVGLDVTGWYVSNSLDDRFDPRLMALAFDGPTHKRELSSAC